MKMLRKISVVALLVGAFVTFGIAPLAHADFSTVTPAGTTLATATTVPATDVLITSATADQGVVLKSVTAGSIQSVTNGSSVNIKVYPPSGAKINNGTASAAIVLVPNSRVNVTAYDATNYVATFASLGDAVTATFANTLSSGNNGTVTTSATTVAEEHGDSINHFTKLTMTAFALGTSGDNAALSIGAAFYTWPATTVVQINNATISGGVTCAISVTTNTPEVGIGTTIGTGAQATLSTTEENVVDGGVAGGTVDADTVAPDVAGTAFQKTNLSTIRPIIQASGGAARDLFLNIGVTWADVAAAGACTFTGIITLDWKVVG